MIWLLLEKLHSNKHTPLNLTATTNATTAMLAPASQYSAIKLHKTEPLTFNYKDIVKNIDQLPWWCVQPNKSVSPTGFDNLSTNEAPRGYEKGCSTPS